MAMFVEAIKLILWLIISGLFSLLQTIVWIITGTSRKIRINRSEDAYANTAHVRRIVFRYKIDLLAQPSGLNNFLTVHQRFRDPEYVLSPNVTLYALTENEAIFVESDFDVDVTKSKYSPFLRVAQFKYARQVIVLPIAAFEKLAHSIDLKEDTKLIVVSMTSRCGSTLLTQIFEERGDTISLSEPDAMATLFAFQSVQNLTTARFDAMTRSVVNILCKQKGAHIKNYLIKLAPQVTPIIPTVLRVFPQSKQLFMYRRGLDMCMSLSRAFQEMPLLRILSFFGRYCPNLIKYVARRKKLPTYGQYFETMVRSRMAFACCCWGVNIRQYVDMRNEGVAVAAVRYEDMLADIFDASNKIFEYCEVERDDAAVERAHARDAQQGSPFARERLSRHSAEAYTTKTSREMDKICDGMNVPRLTEQCLLPGTVTVKSDAGLETMTHVTLDCKVPIEEEEIEEDFFV